MKNLLEIVAKLNKEEKRHFRLYLHRIKGIEGDNKVEQLFDFINQKKVENEEELCKLLYPGQGKNAYYRLKNRLFDDLERSLLLLHGNMSDRIAIMSQISISEIYIYKSLYKEAFELLRHAERKAVKADYNDLLTTIYALIVKMAFQYDNIDLQTYIQKQLQNLERYQTMLQTDHLIKTLSYRLMKTNFDTRDTQIGETLSEIQQQLSIRPELMNSPKMQLDISNVIRRSLLQKQDYAALETYLITNFEELEQKQVFKKETHAHKIVAIVWIINTLQKTRKFGQMSTYTQLLHDALLAYNKLYYDKYVWTYYQCIVTQYFYDHKPEQAIVLLETLAKESHHSDGSLYYDTFVHANLAVLYFCTGNVRKAMSSLTPLLLKESFGKQSVELQLRFCILEIVLHFENEDFDFLDYKINETRNTFRDLLHQDSYKRETDFLKILKKCLNVSRPFSDTTVKKIIQQFIAQSPPFAPGSNEFISYQLWLKSKIEKINYYELVLNAVRLV